MPPNPSYGMSIGAALKSRFGRLRDQGMIQTRPRRRGGNRMAFLPISNWLIPRLRRFDSSDRIFEPESGLMDMDLEYLERT